MEIFKPTGSKKPDPNIRWIVPLSESDLCSDKTLEHKFLSGAVALRSTSTSYTKHFVML